jgi:hypothetical protein
MAITVTLTEGKSLRFFAFAQNYKKMRERNFMELEELKKKARALTRGEVRKMKEAGFNMSKPDPEKGDEIIDAVVGSIYGDPKALDDLPTPDVFEIYREIMNLTWPKEKSPAEKNSLKSGPGMSTAAPEGAKDAKTGQDA